jgi:hypothetical protein
MSFASDLEMSGHCSCSNIIMVPTLMMSTATGKLRLIYPWNPEFTLTRVLAQENFRFPWDMPSAIVVRWPLL